MVRAVRGPTGYEVMRRELRQDENGLKPRIQSRQEIRNDRLTEKHPYEVPRAQHVEGQRRGQMQQADVVRKAQPAAVLMPSGPVEHDHRVTARRDPGADLGQVQVHLLGIDVRQHQCRADIASRTFGAKDIALRWPSTCFARRTFASSAQS